MGLDVDYVAAKQAINELDALLSAVSHGCREKIADDIIEFVKILKKEYKKPKKVMRR